MQILRLNLSYLYNNRLMVKKNRCKGKETVKTIHFKKNKY